mgnify:CR=1 FL=1
MTAVDFSAFVDELATLSGAAILPFFRSSLTATDKNEGGLFDPVTFFWRMGNRAPRVTNYTKGF